MTYDEMLEKLAQIIESGEVPPSTATYLKHAVKVRPWFSSPGKHRIYIQTKDYCYSMVLRKIGIRCHCGTWQPLINGPMYFHITNK